MTLKRDWCNAFVQVLRVTLVFKCSGVHSVVTVTWPLAPNRSSLFFLVQQRHSASLELLLLVLCVSKQDKPVYWPGIGSGTAWVEKGY